VLDRNWRGPGGELDLVLRSGRTIVFCEVKARRGDLFGVPAEAVTPTKQHRIRRLAASWLRQSGTGAAGTVRFDVAAVLDGSIEVIEGAF
jgi:putative endonuclease